MRATKYMFGALAATLLATGAALAQQPGARWRTGSPARRRNLCLRAAFRSSPSPVPAAQSTRSGHAADAGTNGQNVGLQDSPPRR